MPKTCNTISITKNDVEIVIKGYKRGKAVSFDGIKDNIFNLNIIAQIAKAQIN